MAIFKRGKYAIKFAQTPADIEAAQRLRYRAFRPGQGDGLDADDLDDRCQHILVEETKTGKLVCCFRMMHFRNGTEIGQSYSAQFYELSSLESYEGSMVEMGRFCIDPDHRDPDILRMAWAAMTRYVDDHNVELLFGCSSFHGAETALHEEALALLKERHLAPKRWLPRPKAKKIFSFAAKLRPRKPNLKLAQKAMPPLLRTYLMMGGWVSDHAVVDHDLDTIHVFTGVEIKSVPQNRVRLLRMTAS